MTFLAVLLLVAVSALRPASADLGPSQVGDRAEAPGAMPVNETVVVSGPRLAVAELSRGLERSRSLPAAMGIVLLSGLLIGAASWRSSLLRRRSRMLSPFLRPFAGPRAPPFQLA
jgi:hypothetical protein